MSMNTTLLREIAQGFLERPETLDMDLFISHCGTVCCIAGEAVRREMPEVFARLVFDPNLGFDWSAAAARILKLGEWRADNLLLPVCWPSVFLQRIAAEAQGTPAYARVVSDRIEHFITTEGRE